jgi:hypothetical protein
MTWHDEVKKRTKQHWRLKETAYRKKVKMVSWEVTNGKTWTVASSIVYLQSFLIISV